ncbi:MAG TPA: hypothetical protein VGB15_21890 [Longimicrobium sp.]
MGRYLGIHTAGASWPRVEAWLDSVAERISGAGGDGSLTHWWWPSASEPVLMAWRDDWADWESEDWAHLAETLGTPELVSLAAHVVYGATGAEAFVLEALDRFGGVAGHDYDDHCWTRDQVASGARVGPRRFLEPGPLEPLE